MLPLAALNTTPVTILAVASLVIGYAGIWALWHFIFSPKREHDDDIDRAPRDAGPGGDPGE